jgi:starvation-inducible DNA-binding protein
MNMMRDYAKNGSKEQLAACLYQTFVDAFSMYFMAHSFHWNVKGPEFTQFHDFFSEIYEDVHGSIDPIAENIRKLGFNAPMNILEVSSCTKCVQSTPSCNPMSMCAELYSANETVLTALYETFHCASHCDAQGIADFIAGRIDQHEKWRWQLGTTINKDQDSAPLFPGKPGADFPVEAIVVVEDQPMGAPVDFVADMPVVMMAAASKPAPKKDRIYGSKTNKPGSAKAKNAKTIKFSDRVEKSLMNKVTEHNKTAKAGRRATLAQLKAVYRRGAGAYSSSHRPGKTRDQWAMARVNAYLKLLRSGSPDNKNYTQDNDLLPSAHPRSSKKDASILAAGDFDQDYTAEQELIVELLPSQEYATAEDAIMALAEYSDMGYEIIPSLRAAWKRAVDSNDNPFNRAYELAVMKHSSRDSDLLPREN